MSYNTKNYVEQGGERLVIGGEMEFKEGARVTGLPTAIVLDFQGQNLMQARGNPVDVTDLVPLDLFLEATQCRSPIIIRGLMFNNEEVGVQGMATKTNQGIYVMAGYNGYGAALIGVITLLLYCNDNRVYMLADGLSMFDDEYVDGVNVYPDNITLVVGAEQELTPEVYPSTAVNKTVYWVSSDESVATLSAAQADALDSGTPVTVTALREGTAEITVTTEEGGFTATCYVTVIPAAEESMKK